MPGCGSLSGSGGAARLQSLQNTSELRAELPTRIYTARDPDTVDIYMTNLPESVWNSGADVSDMTGLLVHVHMFIRPKAGRTPIADTASTATVRCLVLANGELGVYGGGGFFVDASDAGDEVFSGTMREATVRLVSATGGFNDRLGVAVFSGKVAGTLDRETAQRMDRAMRALIAETQPVDQAEPE